MDSDESRSSSSLDYSDIDDKLIVAKESLDSSKKRKLRADESDMFLPLPKHFCPDSSCPSSDIESAECSYTKPSDETSSASYSTGISSSSSAISSDIDRYCSKVIDKTQEDGHDVEDLTLLEFIYPKFDVADEVLNPVGSSYVLSSARWSVSNQVSEVVAEPTIDQEFEDYFSTLMM